MRVGPGDRDGLGSCYGSGRLRAWRDRVAFDPFRLDRVLGATIAIRRITPLALEILVLAVVDVRPLEEPILRAGRTGRAEEVGPVARLFQQFRSTLLAGTRRDPALDS